MRELPRGVRVHMVGIGGSGLSAIARVLHGWGYFVTGSDQMRSANTDALLAEGIVVQIGHMPENLEDPRGTVAAPDPLVVVSSAVPDDNPEVVAAKQRGLTIVTRRALLEALTRGKTTIAVAGTHGKTTTTAMIAWILVEAGLDPSFVVGGILQNMGTNARAGSGDLFAVEADEYDRAFLGLKPRVAVVTSLEHDHPDCFPTFADMQDAFAEFAARALDDGQLIVCGEDPAATRLAERVSAQPPWNAVSGGTSGRRLPSDAGFATYGFEPGCTWQAEDVQLNGCPIFRVRAEGRRLGQVALQLPGRHNVLNALAAIAATAAVEVDFGTAAAALTRFRGTARRFEVKGHFGGITVVDDYAHHPTAIRVTLAAARSKYPGRAIWVVFQPHTFSRTLAMLDDFARSFGDADHVLVTGIYAARERDTGQVSGAEIVSRMKSSGVQTSDSHYVESISGAAAWLLERIEPGAVVITLGAGDGYRVGELVLERLRDEWSPGSSPAPRGRLAGLPETRSR
jgi:UDP-N-acetylmuramate--alanine ligase